MFLRGETPAQNYPSENYHLKIYIFLCSWMYNAFAAAVIFVAIKVSSNLFLNKLYDMDISAS